MTFISIKKLVRVQVRVVDSLPENEYFVVATDCYGIPDGYTVLSDDLGRLFAIKNS